MCCNYFVTQLVVTMAENVGVQDNLQHISFSVFVYRLKSKIMLHSFFTHKVYFSYWRTIPSDFRVFVYKAKALNSKVAHQYQCICAIWASQTINCHNKVTHQLTNCANKGRILLYCTWPYGETSLHSVGSSLTLQLGGTVGVVVGGQRGWGNSFLGVAAHLTGLASSRPSSGHR